METLTPRAAEPPEDWLLKAYHDNTLVDLIFAPAGGPVTDELLELVSLLGEQLNDRVPRKNLGAKSPTDPAPRLSCEGRRPSFPSRRILLPHGPRMVAASLR